jgi:hypothetical protein
VKAERKEPISFPRPPHAQVCEPAVKTKEWIVIRTEDGSPRSAAKAKDRFFPHSPRPQYWYNVALGSSYIYLSNIANTSAGRIGVRVYIKNKVADVALPQLEADREAIEKEIGEPLQWNPNPENRDKIILLDRPADLNDRNKWPEYVSWLVERVAKFKKAFEPRIKKLDLAQARGTELQA